MMSGLVLRGAAVVLAAVALAPSASAQLAPGRSGYSTVTTFGGSEVWRSLGEFGRCYASRNTEKAFEFIATEPGSREEAKVYRKLFSNQNQSCLSLATEMRVPYTMVRGAIAEGLYHREVPLPPNLAETAPEAGTPIDGVSMAARCYTAAHRAQVRALIEQTSPGGEEEHAAIEAMMPDFGQCLPEGMNVQFDATRLRFRLAEALCRMPAAAQATEAAE